MNARRIWRALPVLFLLSPLACSSTSYVERIEIENPTQYDVLVAVEGNNDGRLQLGVAKREAESVREQVVDMGDDWRFTFSYRGEEIGSTAVKRQDLERSSWRVVIPEEVGTRLREKGVQASY